ncbi:MAG TPA: hypothetical protein VFR24_20180 [Candidatus Angelobacter sp.]|nr:hypothetical protein [Candidatus Angelobacter sp.]
MQIELKCGDKQIRAAATGRDSYESRHSHKTLELIDIVFDTLTEDHKDWAAEYGSSNGIVEAEGKKWEIEEPSYHYQEGSPVTRFNWKLREIEDFQGTQLVIDDWPLTPYKYHEELSGEALIVQARVEMTPDEFERFLNLPRYFPVIRKGIEDQPREMRLGQCLWSETADKYRVQVYLVESVYDKKGGHGVFQPQSHNDATRIVHSAIILDRLLDSLVKKGVISAEESEQLTRFDDEKKIHREMAKRDRVDDLDKWLDREERA